MKDMTKMMSTIKIPYDRTTMNLSLARERIRAILEPAEQTASEFTGSELVRQALLNPLGSRRLGDLAAGAAKVLIITSDHTRPLPSALTMPLLLAEIRLKNPKVKIKILIATGCHRPSSQAELIGKFGQNIVDNEDIVNHDCHDSAHLVGKGILPSGGELVVNSLVDWADLIVAEGFIEPHFFAGFSGGAKSILPGICGAATVLANHNAAFIADAASRTGNLTDNLLQKDMWQAAAICRLRFCLNITLDANKRIAGAYAGDPQQVHTQGCLDVSKSSSVPRVVSDIVITSNGGYPLDQNIYQAVKGMTTASSCVRPGGVIIMVAACIDGHGGADFYRWFAQADTAADIIAAIEQRPADETLPDQWQAQILAKILDRNQVILVTRDCDPKIIRQMQLLHAKSLTQAMDMADGILGSDASITLIPDGVSVIVEESASLAIN